MPNTSGNLSQADRMNQPKLAKFVRGKWQIDGDVIEQTETSRGAMLLFGSPDFGEGDFTCEALRVDGDHGMAIVARATDDENYYYFDVGVFNIATTSYHHVVAKEADGDWRVLGFKKDGPNPADRWMKLRLRLRGDSIESYLDDQLVVSTKDDRRLQGYLGLRTWNAAGKYRNLKFTDINGKVLWQGLPEIPEQKSGLAIPANFTDSLGIAAAPDRRAAEWVLSVGGKVKVNDQDEFADSSSLPTVPFRLSYVGLGDNVQVTDADMAIFKDCEHLAALGLENTKVSDAGLIQFRDLRTLTHLYLQGSAVTDRGLTYFKDCSNLLSLGLGETHISDEALKIIGGLNKLQVVDLTKTQVTEQGIEELQRKLPNCKIIWDGGVIAPQETASLPGDKASSVSCDYGTLATGHWTPVLTRPAETVESRNAMLRDGVIEIQNGHAYDKSITAANVIVRAQVQKLNGQTVLITLRDVLGVYCSAVYQFDGVERFGVGTRDARFRYSVKQYFESSVDAKEGAFFELAFSAVGDTLTVYANGKRVGEFRDSSIARPGGVAVHATKGKGVFKDVEVMVLDKAVP